MNMKYRSNIYDYSLQKWNKIFLCIDYLEGIHIPYLIPRQKPISSTISI